MSLHRARVSWGASFLTQTRVVCTVPNAEPQLPLWGGEHNPIPSLAATTAVTLVPVQDAIHSEGTTVSYLESM